MGGGADKRCFLSSFASFDSERSASGVKSSDGHGALNGRGAERIARRERGWQSSSVAGEKGVQVAGG
jgi:hypothetical protein